MIICYDRSEKYNFTHIAYMHFKFEFLNANTEQKTNKKEHFSKDKVCCYDRGQQMAVESYGFKALSLERRICRRAS